MRKLLLIVAVAVACGGSGSSDSTGTAGTAETLLIQASGASTLTIAGAGGMLQLTAYKGVNDPYSGSSMRPVEANWSSANTSVATVDSSGLVTAVANGTSVITASSTGASGSVTVTVGM
jgi:Bacterial Ig-like domain (group 2)